MSVGAWKSSFSLESRVQWLNTVGSVLWEGGARRCHPGFSSLVPWRWRRPSCSVPVAVMAWDGPGPPGRGASVHIRRSGNAWKSRIPREGGPGSRPRMQSAPLGRARDIARPLPRWEMVWMVCVGRTVTGAAPMLY
jgi:hypothetical protein